MRRTWIALALLAFARASIGAQDHAHDPESVAEVHARMNELMGGVEARLKAIDQLLNEAAARGGSGLAAGGNSAIDHVLVESRRSAQRNVEDIDEVLRLSLHAHPPGEGKGGGA